VTVSTESGQARTTASIAVGEIDGYIIDREDQTDLVDTEP
jgi:hypothetical protein